MTATGRATAAPRSNRPLNPRRIAVLTYHTFLQLSRMKVFYFMALFALIVLAGNIFNFDNFSRADMAGSDALHTVRTFSLGAMTLFSTVLAVVATALLLPRDVEDRTLYTILAKPVPRLDYLAGKLCGVLMLLFVSLLLMDGVMSGVLAIRTHSIVAAQIQAAELNHWPAAQIQEVVAATKAQGLTWSLHGAIFALFLKSAVIASAALLVSTFATSTLFTTIVGFLLFFIGSFQADARSAALASADGTGPAARAAGLAVAVIFPDFQLFNVIDAVVDGAPFPPQALGMLAGVTAFYLVLHLFVSWLIFARKEF